MVENVSPIELPPITTLRPVDAQSFHTSAVRSSGSYDDDEDEEMHWGEDEPRGSDDEFESEDDVGFHHDPRIYMPSTSSSNSTSKFHQPLSHPQPPRSLYGAFSGYPSPEQPDRLVDRLKSEVEGLKRQSSEALTASLKMSDQLAEAQADANKARAALRAAESRLEDEKRRRIEAEMAVDEETRRRRAAEDGLRSMQRQLHRGTANQR